MVATVCLYCLEPFGYRQKFEPATSWDGQVTGFVHVPVCSDKRKENWEALHGPTPEVFQ